MRVHAVYLAVIALLIVLLAYAAAKAFRARKTLQDVEERFGLRDEQATGEPRKGGETLRPYRAKDILRERAYEECRREVDALVARAQALEEFGAAPKQLAEACALALQGGKRLRAIILLEVARATSARRSAASAYPATPVDAAEAALFIEYLHAASLIVDDLPEFDNDLERRGRPAVHAAVGPAVAQMAALALVAAAFQNICRQIDWIRDNCPEVKNVDRVATRMCAEVGRSLGALGAAGGQTLDITSPSAVLEALGEDASAEVARRKTASFFELAVVSGWLVAGGEAEQVPVLRDIGRLVGTAFQLADDLRDMESDAERDATGAPRSSWNFANTYGSVAADRELERNLNGARLLLSQCGLWTPLWKEIVGLIRGVADEGRARGPTPAPSEPRPPSSEPRPAPSEPRLPADEDSA
jgi:geranylgeranyl pyrophosphate synthase